MNRNKVFVSYADKPQLVKLYEVIMRNFFVFILFLVTMISCKENDIRKNKTVEIIEINLENIDESIENILSKFFDKKIYELLNCIKEDYTHYYPIDEPPGKLRGWSFYYNNNCNLNIYFRYKPEFFSERPNWKLEDFLDEKIILIKISQIKNDERFYMEIDKKGGKYIFRN
jgi:hypothetical protein